GPEEEVPGREGRARVGHLELQGGQEAQGPQPQPVREAVQEAAVADLHRRQAAEEGQEEGRRRLERDVDRMSELSERHRRLAADLAELQWDLGGLTYEMAIRDHFRLDVLVRRAARLQEVDAELAEVERLLKLEDAGA